MAEPNTSRPAQPRKRFRHWRRTRPFWAAAWTILGGTIVAVVPGTGMKFAMFAAGSILLIGVMVGVVIVIMGMFLLLQPSLRYIASALILVLSLFSFMTSDFGGFFIGMLFGIIGGCLGLAWTPRKSINPSPQHPLAPAGHDSPA